MANGHIEKWQTRLAFRIPTRKCAVILGDRDLPTYLRKPTYCHHGTCSVVWH